MKKLASIICCVVLFGLVGCGSDMDYSTEKQNQLIEQKIAQKNYEEANSLNDKYFAGAESIYKSNAEKISKCESMQLSNIKDYESICNKIEIVDKKVEYSNGAYIIDVKCRNNNENMNLKNVKVEFLLEDREKPSQKLSITVNIDDTMKANGGQAIGHAKKEWKKDEVRYGTSKVIECGSIVKDSEIEDAPKKDDYMKINSELVNSIQTRIPEMKVTDIGGDEFGKSLYVDVKMQHNLNSTYEIVSELPVLFETKLKDAQITTITANIIKENGELDGLIVSELSGGTYKPTLNTCE